jgi:hypothetical protein
LKSKVLIEAKKIMGFGTKKDKKKDKHAQIPQEGSRVDALAIPQQVMTDQEERWKKAEAERSRTVVDFQV